MRDSLCAALREMRVGSYFGKGLSLVQTSEPKSELTTVFQRHVYESTRYEGD